MIPNPDDLHAWIFVSHASADLDHVRRVRNYLEEKGASPLLFHLRALTDERKFWPIIEQEIAARNFFLYCDSAAAQASPWVKRERETVAEIARLRPVRVGRISVEEKVIDATGLDRFIAKTRVFPSYASKDRNIVEPYLEALASAGFQIFIPRQDVVSGQDWRRSLDLEIEEAAQKGWVLVFVTANSVANRVVEAECSLSRLAKTRLVPVLLDGTRPPHWMISEYQWFDATRHPSDAPARLARNLLLVDRP